MSNRFLLEAKNIIKTFPPTVALNDVHFCLRPGEIHGLMGENGSGKSTMCSIVSGIYPYDSGELFLDGEPYCPKNMIDAAAKGVCMIVQEQGTFASTTVAENIFIGKEKQFFTCREVVRQSMKPNQYGRIIMVSSIHGVCGRKGVDTAPYAAAKGGIVNLTRSLGNSWARDGITVNCICPGYFPTEMTAAYIDAPFFHQAHLECCPMERHGETGEMDGLCTYFASPACSYTTGQIVCVDGGWSAI